MSALLLDSHIFYWYDTGDSRLTPQAVTQINRASRVCVSAASIWEMSIKSRQGKLGLSGSLIRVAQQHGFELLPVEPLHAEAIAGLPIHHRDPFDHMLIAQAQVEGLMLVTHDRILSEYGVPVLLV